MRGATGGCIIESGDRCLRGFDEIGRMPAPGDNVAIATRTLKAGTRVAYEGSEFTVGHTVLEGHRFAVREIGEGEDLLSWGLPFGRAVEDISPGDYTCNPKILAALAERHVPFELPPEANFRDGELTPYVLDEASFRPGGQVPLHPEPRAFMGYRRGAGRGVGTRNYVVVVGTTSRLTGFVRALEGEMRGVADGYEDVDGIVCVAHTEGGEGRIPNNLDLLLRTLAGFMVNPNVGAVLAPDHAGEGAVDNAMLRAYLRENAYPIRDLPHEFMSLAGGFRADLERAKGVVRGWLDTVNAAHRGADLRAQGSPAMRRVGRVLRGLGEPAGGEGGPGDHRERRGG